MAGKLKVFQKNFARCQNYAQASKVMEALSLGPAAHTNAELYFAIDPAQQDIRTKLLTSIYQEAAMKAKKIRSEEEEEEKTKMEEEEEEDEEEEDEEEEEGGKKKVKAEEEEEEDDEEDDEDDESAAKAQEYEGGTSKISSKPGAQDPALERLDKDSVAGEKPFDQFPSPQNQMKEFLKYLPKAQRKTFLETLSKTGVLDTLNQANYMTLQLNEAVRKVTSPLVREIKILKAGYQALDRKLLEAQNRNKSVSLDIHSPPSLFSNPHHSTRETLPYISGGFVRPRSVKETTDDARVEILQINDAMNSGIIPRDVN